MDGAGAATATAVNKETRSALESMTLKHRGKNVKNKNNENK